RRRCCVGTVDWLPGAGRTPVGSDGHRSAARFASSSFGLRERTHAGVISGSLARSTGWASRSLRPPSGRSSARQGSGRRAAVPASWRAVVRPQAPSRLAVDLFAVETISLRRRYVLFFIEPRSRRVHLAGCTANPPGEWVTQQARQFTWTLQEQPSRFCF